MPIDAYVAFGGVALLGTIGFFAPWFSKPEKKLAAAKPRPKRQPAHS
jgi:hypothetical protein